MRRRTGVPFVTALLLLTGCGGDGSDGVAPSAGSATDGATSADDAPDSDTGSEPASPTTTLGVPLEPGTTLTSAEFDACTTLSDSFRDLALGYDGVGLKDMSSGSGGVTSVAVDYLLNRLNAEGTEAALDGGKIAPMLVDLSRTSRGRDSGWSGEQAQAVGQRYVHVLVACGANGFRSFAHPAGSDWDALLEWVTGVPDPRGLIDGVEDPSRFCELLRQATASEISTSFADTTQPTTLASIVAGASVTVCPDEAAKAEEVLGEALATFGWQNPWAR